MRAALTVVLRVLCLTGWLLSVDVASAQGRAGGAAAMDRAVHRAVLEHWAAELRQGETLYVAPENGGRLFGSEAAAEAWADSGSGPMMSKVPRGMLRAYAHANTHRGQISVPRSVSGRPVVLTTSRPPDASSRPRFVLSMSRPGYSLGGDSAVVFASYVCGPLCGTSSMLLTVRGSRGWRIERELWSVYH